MVSARQLRDAVALARELDGVHDAPVMEALVLDALPRVVPCDTLTLATVDVTSLRVRRAVDSVVAMTPARVAEFERLASQHPSLRRFAATGDPRPHRLSDQPGGLQAFRRTELYATFYRPLGIEHQVCVILPLDGQFTGVMAHRGALDFADTELALLELLRPHLLAAAARVASLERRARAGLTAREVEVLDRVAAGDSNQLIAGRLGVRTRTIDKHLEHAYAKLGVSSRTAAVARIRGIAH